MLSYKVKDKLTCKLGGVGMTDERIIQLFFQRKEEVIDIVSKKYGAYCYKIANNILKNQEDSEECLNDTWLEAWKSIPPAKPVYLNFYLAKIVRNISFNRYKAKHTQKRGCGEIAIVLEELEECIAGQSEVEEEYIAKELHNSINKFAYSLSKRDCNVFVRRYFFAESIQEISKRYHISENNVSVILNRCRRKLKSHLKKEGYIL